MRHVFCAALLAAVGCSRPVAGPAPKPVNAEDLPALAESRRATQDFGARLKSELVAGLEAGGPAGAIEVCQKKAPQIAAEVSAQKGLQLGRVSLRTRNPANAGLGWKKEVLDQFEARAAKGEPVESLEHHAVAEQDGQRVLRYAKAIGVQTMCLGCHGTSLDPELKQKLEHLYPADRATGYEAGQLRGAFWVETALR